MDSLLIEKKRFFYSSVLLAILGCAISIYATSHHIQLKSRGTTDYSCNINDTFSCDSVAQSQYSELFGVPMGVWGLSYFASLLLLLLLGRFVPKNFNESLQAYTVMVPLGVAVSIVLGGISLFSLGTFCISCIGVYFCCFALALVLYIDRDVIPAPMQIKQVGNGEVVAILLVTVCIFGYNKLVSSNQEPSSNDISSTLPKGSGIERMLLPEVFSIKIDKNNYSGYGVDYRKGGADAKVVITEFADFQCPGCAQASKELSKVFELYGDRVLIVFKNYPLDKKCNPGIQRVMHEHACDAASLARCAGEKGKFWELHDHIFSNQGEIDEHNLKSWAKSIGGLNDQEIERCLKSPDVLAKIRDDINQGHQFNVDSTPTIYFNGRKYLGGRSETQLSQVVDYLLTQ